MQSKKLVIPVAAAAFALVAGQASADNALTGLRTQLRTTAENMNGSLQTTRTTTLLRRADGSAGNFDGSALRDRLSDLRDARPALPGLDGKQLLTVDSDKSGSTRKTDMTVNLGDEQKVDVTTRLKTLDGLNDQLGDGASSARDQLTAAAKQLPKLQSGDTLTSTTTRRGTDADGNALRTTVNQALTRNDDGSLTRTTTRGAQDANGNRSGSVVSRNLVRNDDGTLTRTVNGRSTLLGNDGRSTNTSTSRSTTGDANGSTTNSSTTTMRSGGFNSTGNGSGTTTTNGMASPAAGNG